MPLIADLIVYYTILLAYEHRYYLSERFTTNLSYNLFDFLNSPLDVLTTPPSFLLYITL